MGKIVIIDTNSTMIPQVGVMLDEALIAKESGHEVIYITCGTCLKACHSNPLNNQVFCKICVHDYKHELKKIMDGATLGRVVHKTLQDYSKPDMEKEIDAYDASFSSVEDIKKKTFKGIDVGYAALSSFISNTRNLNPVLTPFSVDIITRHIRTAVQMALLCEQIYQKENPEKVIIFNARLPETRPVLRFFLSQNIPVDVKEVYPTNEHGDFKKVTFHNAMPHSIQCFQERMAAEWDKDTVKAKEVGEQFYNSRRNAAFTGDKIYIRNQKAGMLPAGWNKSKRNIVIFNSSEDEFVSVGQEWEKKLFPTQIEGIKHLFALAKKYPDADVYLRVHPNLKNITYKYHTDLYRLDVSKNVHVISADSAVSTYTLVDAADVVVSFGSTVGVEAVYAKKPVVLMRASWYGNLSVCYEPQSYEEAENLIFQEKLKPLYNDNVLKYGNYVMADKGEGYVHYNFNCRKLKIGPLTTPNYAMAGQAVRPFGAMRSFAMRFWRWLQRQELKLRIPEA